MSESTFKFLGGGFFFFGRKDNKAAVDFTVHTSKKSIGSGSTDEQQEVKERDLVRLEGQAHPHEPINDGLGILFRDILFRPFGN